MDAYILHLGKDIELHTADELLDRLRDLMHAGEVKPGYHVSKWSLVDLSDGTQAWVRDDD